jgi:hypothetical protein
LDAAGQKSMAADLEKFWADHNEGPPHQIHVRGEYLEVHARKAPR